jgi:phosphomannomutase
MRSVKRRSNPAIFVDPDVFKSYDIRGTVPGQLNPEIARLVGRAFAVETKGTKIAVGRDMRSHSEELAESVFEGLMESGCQVLDVGRVSTDALYFAVSHLQCDGGIMITASHNPPEYNGFKLCRAHAEPLSKEDGIQRMQDLIELEDYDLDRGRGSCETADILPVFIEHVLSFVNPSALRPFKVVVDAGNGMAGAILPTVFERLPLKLVPMYFELDGTFPNHPASPIEPENLKDLQERILAEKADFGVAFDGDADRMFLVDEKARPLGGDVTTMLVAKSLLAKNPGATIIYNLICSRAVPEMIEREGGRPIRTPVGHSLIKPIMKREEALFGGEHSGHFYFRDNSYADSGLIAMLMAAEVLSEADRPLSELVDSLDPYFRSGEINVRVRNATKTLEKVDKEYREARIDRTDGITVSFEDWWFNVRPSNTEPLLRLNVEATSADLLEEKKAEVLTIVQGRRRTSKAKAKTKAKPKAKAKTKA